MTHHRRGISLTELLVIIGVLGVMVCLLLPALQDGHHNSHGVQCQSNMRNVALGLQGYLNNRNSFPNAATLDDTVATAALTPASSNLYYAAAEPAALMAGLKRSSADTAAAYSWVVDILPYLDNTELYNAWNKNLTWLDRSVSQPGTVSNYTITNTAIPILKCPDDHSTQPGTGYLSYVVNGGFSLWPGYSGASTPIHPVGWVGTATGGAPSTSRSLSWGSDFESRAGVFALGTLAGDAPWDYKTTSRSVTDGMSTTLMVSENNLAGYSLSSPNSGGLQTGWSCPLPAFIMFLASDNVCGGPTGTGACGADLAITATTPPVDGTGWRYANHQATFENINYAQKLTVKGSFPYPNAGHRGGVNVAMCDGSVHFISSTVDGTVWSKLITPSGGEFPDAYRQFPVSPDAFQ